MQFCKPEITSLIVFFTWKNKAWRPSNSRLFFFVAIDKNSTANNKREPINSGSGPVCTTGIYKKEYEKSYSSRQHNIATHSLFNIRYKIPGYSNGQIWEKWNQIFSCSLNYQGKTAFYRYKNIKYTSNNAQYSGHMPQIIVCAFSHPGILNLWSFKYINNIRLLLSKPVRVLKTRQNLKSICFLNSLAINLSEQYWNQ